MHPLEVYINAELQLSSTGIFVNDAWREPREKWLAALEQGHVDSHFEIIPDLVWISFRSNY